jgi:hypothetical protein
MAKKSKPVETVEQRAQDPSGESADDRSAAPSTTAESTAVGRPKGKKNIERREAAYKPAQCPACKSTRREPFRAGPVQTGNATVTVDGQVYNRQIWRNTKCKDCAQHYRVIEYRFEPTEGTDILGTP